MFAQQAVNGNFLNKILLSVEAHFTLGGYANKQYCRIWGFEKLQVIELLVHGNFSNTIFFSDEGYFTKFHKIVVFGFLRSLMYLKRGHYIQKKSLFGAFFGSKV